MYKNAKELIEKEITTDLEIQIYKSIKNGIEVYKEFENENSFLFSGSLSNNVMPRIITYCVEKQFSPEMYVSKEGFNSRIIKVNNFGYEVAEIKNDNLVIHFSKVKGGIFKASSAKYKLKYAKNNSFMDNQMIIGEMNNNLTVKDGLYYGMVTYSIDESRKLKTLNLLIPNSQITSYLENIDIKKIAEKFNVIEDKEENYKKIVSLKEDILNKRELFIKE
ncbi:putative uncharacterized protein [Clostridium sp. CAG:470]|nr:MAG: hypothetical protein BHW03_01435 [Clostridium sp. 28_17]CDE14935.1 putative uncharacterized protein [Clostridium sp. CAG:470]